MASVVSGQRRAASRTARLRTPAPPPRRPRGRVLLIVAALVVLAAAGAVAGIVTVVDGGPALPPPVTEPSAYHVVYAITAPGAAVRQETRDVSRPYDGRTLVVDASGNPTQGSLTNSSGSFLFVNGKWARITSGRHRAAGAESPVPALRAGIRRGLARVVGSATVLGRPCTMVRTRTPPGSPLAAPTATDFADLCLDRTTGVMLREQWTVKGRLTETRVAVAFATTAPASLFAATPAGPDLGAQYSGQPGVPHDTRLPIGQIPPLPVRITPPSGYHLDAAQLENVVAPTGAPQSTVVEHLVGPAGDLLDVEVGDVSPSGPGVAVHLPGSRTGKMTYDLTASQLVFEVGSTSVMLTGTDPQLLIRASSGLVST